MAPGQAQGSGGQIEESEQVDPDVHREESD
jgi:hypothetical protein